VIRPKERLLRKRIPKEEIRRELERWSDRLSHWNEFSTAVVVLGLAIEYLPDAASFLGIFSHAIFVVLHVHADLLRQFGGLLVVVGVAGELWTDVRESKVESDLRDESNTQIAELHDRAAKAEKDAAEANLENARIRRKFEWRVLSREAIDGLIEALLPYAGFRIDIFIFSKTMEVVAFADMLNHACLRAGCNSKLSAISSDRLKIPDTKGVIFTFAADATPQENDVSPFVQMAVATALRRSSIEFSQASRVYKKTDKIEPEVSTDRWFVSVDPTDIAPFRIQISEKNLLEHNWPVTPPQA
jgi:hypothetical protein